MVVVSQRVSSVAVVCGHVVENPIQLYLAVRHLHNNGNFIGRKYAVSVHVVLLHNFLHVSASDRPVQVVQS